MVHRTMAMAASPSSVMEMIVLHVVASTCRRRAPYRARRMSAAVFTKLSPVHRQQMPSQ